MPRIRRALGLAVAVVLCAHAGMLGVSVTVLASQVADDGGMVCTCAHGNGLICPMHHRRTPRPSEDRCAMQDASQTPALAAVAWLDVSGVMPVRAATLPPAPVEPVRRDVRAPLAAPSFRPDPPPPRA
jgi:hypothetical protein